VFGSVIAEGKLITIGRKLGVRIVRVAGSGNEQSA
jgi:flagellar motor switch/type III secretory pathway protein FliN